MVALALAAIAGGSLAAQAASVRADAMTTLPPGAAATGWLGSVSCSGSGTCMAVGSHGNSAQPDSARGLSEEWNGSRWRVVRVADIHDPYGSELGAVSCATATSCVAVGEASLVPTGESSRPLIERFNGKAWTEVPPAAVPGGSGNWLDAVSCTSAEYCLAVGSEALEWNGTRWRRLSLPYRNTEFDTTQLRAVSCSGSRCMADGTDYVTTSFQSETLKPVALEWDGTSFARTRPVVPAAASGNAILQGISCGSPNDCIATGFGGTGEEGPPIAERWNGSRWRLEPVSLPRQISTADLTGVSCPANGHCVAVGDTPRKHGRLHPLAEERSRGRWTAMPTPRIGPRQSILAGVSCSGTGTSRSCAAVGHLERGGLWLPLAEEWSDGRWAVEHTPT